jgi:hypothetical protein
MRWRSTGTPAAIDNLYMQGENSMSDSLDAVAPKPNRSRKARPSEVDDLRSWLASLAGTPKLHINGPFYPTAVVTVDFGIFADETSKLSPDQAGELVNRLRSLAKAMFKNKEVTVRVQNDAATGIWWGSVA